MGNFWSRMNPFSKEEDDEAPKKDPKLELTAAYTTLLRAIAPPPPFEPTHVAAPPLVTPAPVSPNKCENCGLENLKLTDFQKRAQDFFDAYVREVRMPSYSDSARGFVSAFLIRAQESKLYTPHE